MKHLIIGLFLFLLTIAYAFPASIEEENPPLGSVIDLWGKQVVRLQFKDPGQIKVKDTCFIYHGNTVVAKVEIYKIGKESVQAKILESTGAPQPGDVVRSKGALVQAQPIDIDSYEKLVYPIFVKAVGYGYIFTQSTNTFFSSLCNHNDPAEVARLNKEISTPGTDGWWNYIRKFRTNFTSPEMRKALKEGDAFLTEGLRTLNGIKPPEAAEKPHKRLVAYMGQLQVLYSSFKDIPDNEGDNATNFIVRLNNRFFVKGSMLNFTTGVISMISQVADEYLQLFPEWQNKDPRANYKKDV